MKSYHLIVEPEIGFDFEALEGHLRRKGYLSEGQYYTVQRRSTDARQRDIKINLMVDVNDKPFEVAYLEYKRPTPLSVHSEPVIIVGAGPSGLFAALKAIDLGFKPIVIERGKDVKGRRRDISAINKHHIVNPESNYCFGEGGAGTFSDGKLYTRSKKRGNVRRIYEILVAHGATEDILFESHPHIGTNKLPNIVQSLRETIIDLGGEIHFNSKVTNLVISKGEVTGVELNEKERVSARKVILATGHSARDIFYLLHQKQILLEAKPFALGVRVEHPQSLIDQIQYHRTHRGKYLPASAYSLAQSVQTKYVQRGVFSFCMCPGGFIVPSATSEGELVVNGMSPSKRNSKFANSGIVATVGRADIPNFRKYGELCFLEIQKQVENLAWKAGGRRQTAPAQRLVDFVENKESSTLPATSYPPGLTSVNMKDILPPYITKGLRTAFQAFGKKMKGYLTNEAQIIGIESRTSSPVRIPRNENFQHPQIKGLFPCGEGAGYAGGIVSAAIDGEKCAAALITSP